jgi:hypothetical protein
LRQGAGGFVSMRNRRIVCADVIAETLTPSLLDPVNQVYGLVNQVYEI